MCRFIGVVADAPAAMSELLADDLEPFLQLACEHKDGWGIAYRDAQGAIQIIKDTDRADDSAYFAEVLDSCVTDLAFIHLRMASPGLAVSTANTHPFGDSRAAFAHNGDFTPVDILDQVIKPDLLKKAQGETDSERFFLSIRGGLDDGDRPEQTIVHSAGEIRDRADRFISLNCLLLTPTGLFAYTEHDPHSEVIGRRGDGYFGLSYRQDSRRTVIASQGWPQPASYWRPLPERNVLEIERTGRIVTVHHD